MAIRPHNLEEDLRFRVKSYHSSSCTLSAQTIVQKPRVHVDSLVSTFNHNCMLLYLALEIKAFCCLTSFLIIDITMQVLKHIYEWKIIGITWLLDGKLY